MYSAISEENREDLIPTTAQTLDTWRASQPSDRTRSRRILLRINGHPCRLLTASRSYKASSTPKIQPLFLFFSLASVRYTGEDGGGEPAAARVLIDLSPATRRPPWRGSCWRRSRPPRRRPTRRPGRTTPRRPTAASTRCGGCAASASPPTSSSPRR